MEFSVVLCPSFFLPSEKATSSLQTVLNTPAHHTPREWLDIVLENDPEHNYIVTNLWHYKQRRPLLDCQHEFIVLEVRPRHPPSPAPAPTLIRVSRTLVNDSFVARLGLWGPATNTIEIPPPGTQFTDHCLHQLTWPQNRAPDLYHISRFIHAIHTAMPRYFLVRTSCYAFAGAIKDSIHIRFNGLGGPQPSGCLTRESHFMWCIPTGTTKAQGVAAGMAAYSLDGEEHGQGE
ncbi:hypothetical protein JVT61DRAFT_873 [Boletus reticuloceps]|uniref:Uncharacterized protein n=1 Tax=Boletus reticuloceps TaxID=495285 RepID=A0A8I3AB11_9AGAM|nr:hypothetical protein JVT61DRAFT_873 [Boletus reticuloceps]